MSNIRTESKSTKPNPDEKFLEALIQAENKSLERAISQTAATLRRRKANIEPLLKASGMVNSDIDKLLKEGKELSVKSSEFAEKQFSVPAFDIEDLHERDLVLARENAERMKSPGNPHWQGHIWNPSYGGWWSSWNGEAEEVPNVTFDLSHNRFDPRAQAWGEGWWDSDFSKMHSYLAFQFSPPSWGRLYVYTYPWLHGYYSLYSDDAWYKGENARAELDTWVDLHQNYWRSPQYMRRFTMAGDELHPERAGRIDSQYGHFYSTNVGEGDTVTVRVGLHQYCQAQASGGRSRLNFQGGEANYVMVPYVYWYLYH